MIATAARTAADDVVQAAVDVVIVIAAVHTAAAAAARTDAAAVNAAVHVRVDLFFFCSYVDVFTRIRFLSKRARK